MSSTRPSRAVTDQQTDDQALYDLGLERRERLVLGEDYGRQPSDFQVARSRGIRIQKADNTQRVEPKSHDRHINEWHTFGETTKDRDHEADALPNLSNGQSYRLRQSAGLSRGGFGSNVPPRSNATLNSDGATLGRGQGRQLNIRPRVPPAEVRNKMPERVFTPPMSRRIGNQQPFFSGAGGFDSGGNFGGQKVSNASSINDQASFLSPNRKKKKRSKRNKTSNHDFAEPEPKMRQYSVFDARFEYPEAYERQRPRQEVLNTGTLFGDRASGAPSVISADEKKRPAVVFDPNRLADPFSFMQLAAPKSSGTIIAENSSATGGPAVAPKAPAATESAPAPRTFTPAGPAATPKALTAPEPACIAEDTNAAPAHKVATATKNTLNPMSSAAIEPFSALKGLAASKYAF